MWGCEWVRVGGWMEKIGIVCKENVQLVVPLFIVMKIYMLCVNVTYYC